MQTTESNFKSELRISAGPVIAAWIAVATIVAIFSQDITSPLLKQRVPMLRLILYVVPCFAWLLSRWKSWASKSFLLITAFIIIILTYHWVEIPEVLNLLVIPVGLAAAFFGFAASPFLALGETVILVSFPYIFAPEGNWLTAGIALGAIWAAVGIMWAVYEPVYRVDGWAWDYYRRAQVLLEDARDRKAQLEQALDDLAHANRQLILSNERMAGFRTLAEESQRAKTTFVSKVSHEFRTPLNMIIGLTDLLLETPEVYGEALPLPFVYDLRIVHRNCEHLASMVNDVLALSQVESGRFTLHKELVDLAEVVNGALTVVQPLLKKKQLELRVVMPEQLALVYCDRTRIRQVILNLLSNAARFTVIGGIGIYLEERAGYITISVSDTGPGIAAGDIERIFEPFYQGSEQLWRDKGGSGLGLTISKQFVELHGGQIWVESQPGVGTTLFFKLPLTLPTPPISHAGRWINESWEWHERRTRPPRINDLTRPRLIVYDEGEYLYNIFTQTTEDIECVRVQNMMQLDQELRQFPAHGILLNTTTLDTLWLKLDQLRQQAPELPILGCCIPPQLETSLQAGAVDYLIKPVRRPDLERVIRALAKPVKRILVVDDDPDVRQLLTRTLHTYQDTLEVVTASNGAEALSILRTQITDLVFLDVLMPDMNGWDILEAIQQEDALRPVPVVLVSAQDPIEQPTTSPVLLTTMHQGLSLSQIMRCTIGLTTWLMQPDNNI